MSKKYIIIISIIATILLGIVVGVLISKNDDTSDLETKLERKLATEYQKIENEIDIITTSNVEVKTSPNCIFVFEIYYKECKHTIIERNDIPTHCINQTEEELQKKYEDFQIKKFEAGEIIFYREKEGICDEHYLIKEHNGYIAIYTIDSFGKETLKETTEIVTTYLPQTDIKQLKEGIKVFGQENLNATLEDYE